MGNYDVPLEMEYDTSASIIIKQIADNSKILEFGAANGRMTKYLKEKKKCDVFVIEIDENAYKDAIKYAYDGYCGDIETKIWMNRINEKTFDYILFADVLEHLYNPEEVLKSALPFLKDNGSVLVSVPNIAHSAIILNLMNNRFNYRKDGLLDNTHIRFFTYESLKRMLNVAGYEVVGEYSTYLRPWHTEFSNELSDIPEYTQKKVAEKKYGVSYQFIFKAVKKNYYLSNSHIINIVKDIDSFFYLNEIKIYLGKNGCFEEERALACAMRLGKNTLHFVDLPYEKIDALRINFPEGLHIIKVDFIKVNRKEVNISNLESNALISYGGMYLFSNKDMYMHISMEKEDVESLEISISIDDISNREVLNMFLLQANRKEEDLIRSIKETEEKSLLVKEKEEDLTRLIKETEEKSLLVKEENIACKKELRNIRRKNELLLEDMGKIKKRYVKENETLSEALVEERKRYTMIEKSTSWKITKPIRFIVDQFRKIPKVFLYLKKHGVKATTIKIKDRVSRFFGEGKNDSQPKNTSVFYTMEWIYENTQNQFNYNEVQELSRQQGKISIIVPVFNGYHFLEKLFLTIPQTDLNYELIVIEDASTDDRVLPYLLNLKNNGSIDTLIQNAENLGFVASVNKGLDIAENHVVLLNTDIELPEQWLERIIAPILKYPNIASSTPYTNSGTIFSFPKFGIDNSLFEGLALSQIDEVFEEFRPSYTEVPTGVGFCMALSSRALKEVGIFDEKVFFKGYGEENDWCQRAIKKGYKNVMVENLFVAHYHGGSFPSEDKKKYLERNEKILAQKHPRYYFDVANYISADLTKPYRIHALLELSSIASENVYLAFDHTLGGGATAYLDQKEKEILIDGGMLITIRYDIEYDEYQFISHFKEHEVFTTFKQLEDLSLILRDISFDKIIINELVTYPNLEETLAYILELKEDHKSALCFLLHDYFAICPPTNLVSHEKTYCNIPHSEYCNICLKKNTLNNYRTCHKIEDWRETWGLFFKECEEIIAFSKASDTLFKKAYPYINHTKVIPHIIYGFSDLNKTHKMTTTMNVGIIGTLSFLKGFNVVKDLVEITNGEDNMKFKLIGTPDGIISKRRGVFESTGKYQQSELPRLLLEKDIDVVFIPSIWPETFSYTTEEAMRLGFPVAVFNMGAPAERVIEYDKGLILNDMTAQSIKNELSVFAKEHVLKKDISNIDMGLLFIYEYDSFSFRYRVDHLREQLLFLGIKSSVIHKKDISNHLVQKYSAFIIYRCTVDGLNNFINIVHTNGKKVYYDIDDFIFDYDKIKDLQFLENKKEYDKFEKESIGISQCMSLCDGFIVSTESLKKQIEKSFPKKQVVVNRNVVSLEMQLISEQTRKKESSSKITLGYFSGSRTHDEDFAVINDVLVKVFQKYDNVYLTVVGCLQISGSLEKYNDRIKRYEFVDWRKLPELIATVDINLMPLKKSTFTECKSENKWTEAALVEVPTIMSYNEELARVVENQQTGILCNNQEEWITNLSILIEQDEYRQEIAQKAHETVINKATTRTIENEVVKLLKD